MQIKKLWLIWFGLLVLISLVLTFILINENSNKRIFLIGKLTSGHSQFGLLCSQCHAKPFANKNDLQNACMGCHEKELKLADDSHPRSKFTDPRNAERVAKLDARYCVTCHVEHKPYSTYALGVTLPTDFCVICHYDIAEDRRSHKGLAFSTCQSAGCHNFHDNRALYEDFLVKHGNDKAMAISQVLPQRDFLQVYRQFVVQTKQSKFKAIKKGQEDLPQKLHKSNLIPAQWHKTVHAKAGINCMRCHHSTQNKQSWQVKPNYQVCQQCHKREYSSFLQGKHGIRLALHLSPLTPAMSGLKMHARAVHKQLNCNSCHKAHNRDTAYAAVEACLSCHASNHVNAYKKSPHFQLWLKQQSGLGKRNSGVSCASCHMPRMIMTIQGQTYVWVEHNQNSNLRPNEKMIRTVCLNCHGLRFSINSLASIRLINNNFNGRPQKKVKSIQWSQMRVKGKRYDGNNKK